MGILAKSQRSVTLLVTNPTPTLTHIQGALSLFCVSYKWWQHSVLKCRNWRRLHRVNPAVVLYLYMCVCFTGVAGRKATACSHHSSLTSTPKESLKWSHRLTARDVINESAHCERKQAPLINPWWWIHIFPPIPQDWGCPLTHEITPQTQEQDCHHSNAYHFPPHLNHCLAISVNSWNLQKRATFFPPKYT